MRSRRWILTILLSGCAVLLSIAGLILAGLGFVTALNWQSLGDGLAYVADLMTYSPQPVVPIRRDGRYGSLFDLVGLNNTDRERYIGAWLAQRGLQAEWLPIPNSHQGNWLLRLGPEGPVTLFVAHWDKIHERPSYQGAADNTSGVAVLLAAAETLAAQSPNHPIAFLWTGEEERGLQGARAFVNWAHDTGFQVREVYNFDMLGRGGLVARPVTRIPGFVFNVPLRGLHVFDGRVLRPTEPHPPVEASISQRLKAAQPTVRIARMMTATGDTNVFTAAGWSGAMLSAANIHYLNLTWHTDADRIELMDERNLDLAYQLILALAR